MITVANCFDFNEANHLRMVLESSGIPVFIPDEMTASMALHWFLTSGIRVQVAEQDAVEARKILEEEKRGS